MPWTAPADQTTGTLITASIYNTQIIDNLSYLHGDAGVVNFNNALSTGPTSNAVGGGGTAGNYIGIGSSQPYYLSAASVTTNAALSFGTTTDTLAWKFTIDHAGVMSWGPGGTTPQDTTLARNGAGILQLGTTSQAGSLFLFGSAAATNELATFVAAEAQARWALTADGTTSWGAGGSSARDTTLSRGAASILSVGNKTVEAYATTSGGAGTWTPSLANGLVQRYNMTATGTLTIGSPGAPPAGSSGYLTLIIQNASGGTITLSFNAIYTGGPAGPANGQGVWVTYFYDPAVSKWVVLANAAPAIAL